MITSCLNEYTRKRLLDKAKKDTPDRFARRTDSGDDWKIERVGLLELSVSDDLYIYFKVHDYRLSLRIIGYKPVLMKYLSGKFKGDVTKIIKKSLDHSLRYNHIQLSCECPDFRYRYAFMATKLGNGFETNETRPANKTNPSNKGGLCKHSIKILNLPSKWIPKVVPHIRGFIKTIDREEE